MNKSELINLLVTKFDYDFYRLRIASNLQLRKIACYEKITAVLDL